MLLDVAAIMFIDRQVIIERSSNAGDIVIVSPRFIRFAVVNSKRNRGAI